MTTVLLNPLSFSFLRERVVKNMSVSDTLGVSLALLVRCIEHLGQDVRRTEVRLHLSLRQIIHFLSSLHLLQVKSEQLKSNIIFSTCFQSVSPQSKSMLFSRRNCQNPKRSFLEFAFQFSKYRTFLRFGHSSVRIASNLKVRCLD